ncbi:MAG: hypothetical protein RTU30_00635 [Candidatus Thorarchaeota archaeon]
MKEDDLKRFALSFYDAMFDDQDSAEIDGVVYPIGRSSTRLKKTWLCGEF